MKKALIIGAALFVSGLIIGSVALNSTAKWSGVDESVVKKFAEEAGRQPWESPIHGDALLFFFLLAGATGGFVAGYYYRELFPPRTKMSDTSHV